MKRKVEEDKEVTPEAEEDATKKTPQNMFRQISKICLIIFLRILGLQGHKVKERRRMKETMKGRGERRRG